MQVEPFKERQDWRGDHVSAMQDRGDVFALEQLQRPFYGLEIIVGVSDNSDTHIVHWRTDVLERSWVKKLLTDYWT